MILSNNIITFFYYFSIIRLSLMNYFLKLLSLIEPVREPRVKLGPIGPDPESKY